MKLAHRIRRRAAVAAAALMLASSFAPRGSATEPLAEAEIASLAPAPGERALTARLLAPCCWQGTLDAHESDSAQALRMQIRSRLYAGETAEAIEESFVAQYGERIRARPRHDPLIGVTVALLVVMLFAGIGVTRTIRRWRRVGAADRTATRAAVPTEKDRYDARLDAELADME